MNETHDEFIERHAELKREKRKSKWENEKNKRKKRGLNPPIIKRKLKIEL